MMIPRRPTLFFVLMGLVCGLSACDSGGEDDTGGIDPERTGCIIPINQLNESVAIDAIPALTDPELVGADAVSYLEDDDLVLGFRLGDLTVAVPHGILNWHEVINFNQTTPRAAITFCPLTGSGLAFDRTAIGNAEFGVSGLIYLNNNVVYDRRNPPSLWSQMGTGAICGDASGTPLRSLALIEMTWAGWHSLYPETRVLSGEYGFSAHLRGRPHRFVQRAEQHLLALSHARLHRHAATPEERVLGIPDGEGGLAFPVMALDNGEPMRAVHATLRGEPIVVFFDRARRAAAAYYLSGRHAQRTFTVRDGHVIDAQTGSEWQVDGLAISGELAGNRLPPIAEAYVSFWFAWAAFPATNSSVDGVKKKGAKTVI